MIKVISFIIALEITIIFAIPVLYLCILLYRTIL